MKYRELTLTQLLQNRDVFAVFDEEFHKGTWLNVTALLDSESTLEDLYGDGTVPKEVLDNIIERLNKLPGM